MRKQSQIQTIVLFLVLFFLFLLKSMAGNAQSLPPDELEAKPVVQSFDEALQNPTEVYRLFLCNMEVKKSAAEVEKLVNLHEIYLDNKQVKAFATHLPKLKVLQTVFVEASAANEAEKEKIKQLLTGLKVVFDF
jgi:hypothetical protein